MFLFRCSKSFTFRFNRLLSNKLKSDHSKTSFATFRTCTHLNQDYMKTTTKEIFGQYPLAEKYFDFEMEKKIYDWWEVLGE